MDTGEFVDTDTATGGLALSTAKFCWSNEIPEQLWQATEKITVDVFTLIDFFQYYPEIVVF